MPVERSAVSRRLDFDWRCVVGAVDTHPADYASESPILGLPMSQTFLYGSVRDGDGTIWTPMRWFAAGDGGAASATPGNPPTGSRGARWHRVTAPRRSGIAAPTNP
jgi:hypothetical protein